MEDQGNSLLLLQEERCRVARICLIPGSSLSLCAYHSDCIVIVLEGTMGVTVGEITFLHSEQEVNPLVIRRGEKYVMSNPGKILLVILKIQRGEYLAEEEEA